MGLETHHLFPTVTYRLTCRHEKTISYDIVLKPGSLPSKFSIPGLKTLKTLDGERTEFLYSPRVSTIFPELQKSFPSVLPKTFYHFPLQKCSNCSQRKPTKHKKTSRDKISNGKSISLARKHLLEAKKRCSGIQRRVINHKINYPSSQKPLVLILSSLFSSLLLCTTRI